MGFGRWLLGGPTDLAAASMYPPSTLPPAPAGPLIASPWADPSQLEAVNFAGLYDLAEVLPANRAQAVAIPPIARGRDLICTTVARFPLAAFTSDGRVSTQPRICSQPEQGRARFVTMLWTVDTLLFYGTAFWQIVDRYAPNDLRGPARPRTVRWIPPGATTLDSDGNIAEAFGRPVDPYRDVIRFDGPHEGLLTRGRAVITAARRLYQSSAKASDNPIPAVELHQTAGETLDDESIKKLIAGWMAARRGENGGVAYTSPNVQAIMHGTAPEQLLISGRDAAALDCARAMNLPAWAVDATVEGSSLTYSNVPSRGRELIDYTLGGYLEAIASRLSLDDVLPAGTWCEFSTDVLTDGDFKDRMDAAKAAVDAGVYTGAEMRAREAGMPLEGTGQTP